MNICKRVPLPFTASGSLVTLGVTNRGGDPVTVLLIIPLIRFLCVRVWSGLRLVIEPALRLLGLFVGNFIGSIFIPIFGLRRALVPIREWSRTETHLGSLGIGDSLLVNPVLGLRVLRIEDLLVRVDGGGEVFEKVSSVVALAVEKYVVGVIRAEVLIMCEW